MRLINADALKDSAYINKGNFNTVEGIRKWIDNAPTVEQKYYERVIAQINPVIDERPQGEWIDHSATFWECPDCGYLLEKCCPNCQKEVVLPNSANMRGEKK